jgi:hypothetical protein
MPFGNPLVDAGGVTYLQSPQSQGLDGSTVNRVVIDGTPVRVVVLGLAAAATLTALRWSGVKFNVGVST